MAQSLNCRSIEGISYQGRIKHLPIVPARHLPFRGLPQLAGAGNGGNNNNRRRPTAVGSGGPNGPNGDSSDKKKSSGLLKGWNDRVAYDPEFPIKVLIEQIIGVGASVVGDMSSRPNWGLNELDFVFSTLVVGSIINFSVMYLLAPTGAAGSAAASSFLIKVLTGSFLSAWGAPSGNMFEPGAFGVAPRLLNFAYKGVVFSAIGFCAGLVGTALSNGLLLLRRQMDPNFKLQNQPPNVILNAGCWGLHMGLSSNLRYQVLGGLDQMVVKVLSIPMFRIYSAAIRAGNNILGGVSFVTLARILGVQNAASDAPVPGDQ